MLAGRCRNARHRDQWFWGFVGWVGILARAARRRRPLSPLLPPQIAKLLRRRDGKAQQLGNLRGEEGGERDRRSWQGVLLAETLFLQRARFCGHCRESEAVSASRQMLAASRTVSASRQMLGQVLLILEN